MSNNRPFNWRGALLAAGSGLALSGTLVAHEHHSHLSLNPKITHLENLDTMPQVEAIGIPGMNYTLHAALDFGSWTDDAFGHETEPGHYSFFNTEPSEEPNQFFRVGAERPDEQQLQQLPPIEFLPPELAQIVEAIRQAALAATAGDEGASFLHLETARQMFDSLPPGLFPGTFEDFTRLVLLTMLADTIDAGVAAKAWKVVCVRLIYIGNKTLDAAKKKEFTDLVAEAGAVWRGSCVTFKPEEPVRQIDPATISLTGAGFQNGDTMATFLNALGNLALEKGSATKPTDYKVKTGAGAVRNVTLSQFFRALKAALANHPAVTGSKCLNYFIIDSVRVADADSAVPGFADQPGQFGFVTGDADAKHLAHEFGHNFGLPHSHGVMAPDGGDGKPRGGMNGTVQGGAKKAEDAGTLTLGSQPAAVKTPDEIEFDGITAEVARLKRVAGSVTAQTLARWTAQMEAVLTRAGNWAFDKGTDEAEAKVVEWDKTLKDCKKAIEERLG